MPDPNADQRSFWSDTAGPNWVRLQEQMDRLLQPVSDGLWARAALEPGQKVLDIGSGTGSSCLQAAERVGPGGHVTGVDISDSMVALAGKRTANHANITLHLADAAAHQFEEAAYDHLVSRFGLMFFVDPVTAFRNMRRALKSGQKITFVTWADIPENPYFTLPARMARLVIGAPPKSDPDAPGPFAFRDPTRVLNVLSDAGFSQESCDTAQLMLDGGQDTSALAAKMCHIGPAEVALKHFEADQIQRQALQSAIAEALETFKTGGELQIPAQVHYFTARG